MTCDRRVSLLVMGAMKLILIDVIGLGVGGVRLVVHQEYRHLPLYPLIMMWASTLLFLVDVVYTVFLLWGFRTRNLPVLRLFLWCAVSGFILSVLLTAHSAFVYYMMFRGVHNYMGYLLRDYQFYLSMGLFGIFNLVLQLCIMIVVGLEIKTLRSNRRSSEKSSGDVVELKAV